MKKKNNIKKEMEAFYTEHPDIYEMFYRAIDNDDINLIANLTTIMVKELSAETMVKIYILMDKASEKLSEVYFTGHDEEFNKKMDEISDLIDEEERRQEMISFLTNKMDHI